MKAAFFRVRNARENTGLVSAVFDGLQAHVEILQTYLTIFPALRHFAQTLTVLTVPSTLVFTSIRFGSQVLRVRFFAWETLLPNMVLLPQISHTLDMVKLQTKWLMYTTGKRRKCKDPEKKVAGQVGYPCPAMNFAMAPLFLTIFFIITRDFSNFFKSLLISATEVPDPFAILVLRDGPMMR